MAAGHGKVFDGEDGFYNKELVHTSALPIWSEEECEEVLNKNHFSNFSITWRAHESFLCAGGDLEQDTCEGDGGGPLVCLSDEDNDDDSDEDDGDEDEGDYDDLVFQFLTRSQSYLIFVTDTTDGVCVKKFCQV